MVLYPEGNVQGYQQFCLKLEEGGLFKSEFDKLRPAAQFQLLAVVVLNNTRDLWHGPCDQKIT